MDKRNVLVVGGSSGIGASTVKLLNETGYRTINLDKLEEVNPPPIDHEFVQVDLIDQARLVSALEHLQAKFETFQSVVLLAGVGARRGYESEAGTFDKQLAINLSSYHCILSTIARSIANGGAVVVTSSTGVYLGVTNLGYAAAKAGVIGLMRGFALEFAPRAIRVNAIAPGPVDTPMLQSMATGSERLLLKSCTPLGSLAAPEQISSVIKFLVSDDSSHITGQVLAIDGGLSLAYRPSL